MASKVQSTVDTYLIGADRRLVKQASQSRVLNQACDLMSMTPPFRLPNLLLRSVCMCTHCHIKLHQDGLKAFRLRLGLEHYLKQFSDQIPCSNREVCGKGKVAANNLLIGVSCVLVIEWWVPAPLQVCSTQVT